MLQQARSDATLNKPEVTNSDAAEKEPIKQEKVVVKVNIDGITMFG